MKIILGIIGSLFFAYSHAAPTDCMQLVADGEVNCIKAKSQFQYGVSNAPLTDTFEETISAYESNGGYCKHVPGKTCYIQYENNPIEPPAGKTPAAGVTSDTYTKMDYNTSNNNAGSIATTYYGTTNLYYKYKIHVFHFRICPQGTLGVNAGNDTYLRYCKPPTTFVPESCNTECNQNMGNSTVGN